MAVLVLGGAGYIGSHTVDRLVEQGQDVVVVDSLVTGHKAAVRPEAKFYQGDLADKPFMRKVFSENPEIDAVIHFAAFSLVAESMKDPLNSTSTTLSFHQRLQRTEFPKRCRSKKTIRKIRSIHTAKAS